MLPFQFVITVITEYVVIALFERKAFINLFFIVLGIHFITHPLGGWFIFGQKYNYYLIEIIITITEAILYATILNLDLKRSSLYSIIANFSSIVVGIMVAYLLLIISAH